MLDSRYLAIHLVSAGQNQDANPKSVSHEIQGKVSVHTEFFVGGVEFDNVFDTIQDETIPQQSFYLSIQYNLHQYPTENNPRVSLKGKS